MAQKTNTKWRFLQHICVTVLTAMAINGPAPPIYAASSWNPTLLVNTESFNTIDEGGSGTAIEMRFGQSVNEKLIYDVSNTRFQFSRGLVIGGNITATGSLSVQGVMSGAALRIDDNADIWGNLAVSGTTIIDGAATFGSTIAANSLTYTFPSAHGASGTVLGTDGSGNLTWTGSAGGGTPGGSNTHVQYNDSSSFGGEAAFTWDETGNVLETSGTMSGWKLHAQDLLTSSGAVSVDGAAALQSTVTIGGATTISSTLDTTGTITTDTNLTINDDAGGADAVLTFGNDAGNETFTFSDSSNNFEISDDLDVTGTVNTTGNITTDANLTINEDDGGANAVLTFGNDAGAETITFNDGTNEFDVSDDVNVTGTFDATSNITTNADLTINADNGAANAVLTFGNDAAAETLTFSDSTNKFELSDDLDVAGTLSGSSLVIDDLTNTGEVLYANGVSVAQTTGNASGNILIAQGDNAPLWKTAATSLMWFIDATLATGIKQGPVVTMPFGLTITDIDLSATVPPTGSSLIIDINEAGTTIFSTNAEIDATASVEDDNEVFSDTTLAKGAEITIDIDQVGSTFAGSGLTIMLHGTKHY